MPLPEHLREPVDVEFLRGRKTTAHDPGADLGICCEPAYTCGEPLGVVGLEAKTGDLVDAELTGAASTCCDNGCAAGHRFEWHEAERLSPPRRKDQCVGLGVVVAQLVTRRRLPCDAVTDPELVGERAHLRLVVRITLADDRQVRFR